jgi:hypothetical protein
MVCLCRLIGIEEVTHHGELVCADSGHPRQTITLPVPTSTFHRVHRVKNGV